MNNNVQAYIAVVSFPTSIEELRDLTDGNYYMDMELIILGKDVSYTAPKWAAKNDIIFFYHAKSAIVKIRSLKKKAVGQDDEDKLIEYLDLAEKIYDLYGGSIFCVARVGDNPEVEENEDREHLHWKGNIYAKVSDYKLLKNPVSKNDFEKYIKLAQQRTITPVLGEDFENLKKLILKNNDSISYLENSHAVPIPLKDISPSNWLSVSYNYRRRFYLEMQFRKFYVDYFLKSLGDRKKIYSECTCYKGGKRSGYADNFILINRKYMPVEIKLNIQTEKNLTVQLEKYCQTDCVELDKNTEISKEQIYQDKVLAIDINGIYLYDHKSHDMNRIENLDNIKCEYDIRKLRETIKRLLEV